MSEETKQPEEAVEETAEAASAEGSAEAEETSEPSREDTARAEAEAMVAEAVASADDDDTAEIPVAPSVEEAPSESTEASDADREQSEAATAAEEEAAAESEETASEPAGEAAVEEAAAEAQGGASGEATPPEAAEPFPDYTYDDLNGMTIAALREVASKVEHEAVQGHSQMHKEQLLPALCTALGIEAHVHHEVVGIDKRQIKAKIRELKDERDRALEVGDGEQLKQVRRRIHNLKHQLRKATV